MTEPNYRALCAELLTAIYLYTQLNPAASEMSAFELTEKLMDAMAATSAALAQPEPVAPTDEELLTALKAAIVAFPPRHPEAKPLSADEYEVELEIRKARAVLARSGRPMPQPVPYTERLPGREGWWDEQGRYWIPGIVEIVPVPAPTNALPTPEATND